MARGSWPAEVVARDKHVSLGATIPGKGGVRLVHEASVEGLVAVGAYDGNVVEAEGTYGQRHVGVGGCVVVARAFGGRYLVVRGLRPVRDLRLRLPGQRPLRSRRFGPGGLGLGPSG